MPVTKRDSGSPGRIGLWGVVSIGIGGMVGGGIFAVLGLSVQIARGGAPVAFLVAGLATLSLPGLAPFISEFLVLIGTFTRYPAVAVIATSALVLSAVYILWLYQRVMTGPVRHRVTDLVPREIAVVAPLVVLLLVLGFYPKPALDAITPAVTDTLTAVHQQDPAPTVGVVEAEQGGGQR